MKIAFVGKAGVGKTTMAQYLVRKYGFVRLSFASKLKEFATQILCRPINKHNPKHRRFLQVLGTEAARTVDPNIWIFWLAFDLANCEERGKSVVVDDVRFENEADFLRRHDFVLVKLYGRGYELPKSTSQHKSELELESIDCNYKIDMGKSLRECFIALDRLIRKILKEKNESKKLAEDMGFYVSLRMDEENEA